MIEFENLSKRYGAFHALKGIHLQVEKGELFSYLGPNGAGKSTTIRILTGICRQYEGSARLNGVDIALDPKGSKRQFGLVPQHLNLDSELSIESNLLVHGLLHHMKRRDILVRVEQLLAYVGLSERRREFIKNLSGGLKRRVLIARGLIHSPRILFLDEPTVGLDPNIRRSIWALLKKIQADGTTVFLTTHYIEEAEFLADRVAFLDNGRIVTVDTPGSLTSALGAWAVDTFADDQFDTKFFSSRQEAVSYSSHRAEGCTVRRVSLEDAFLRMTGKKI